MKCLITLLGVAGMVVSYGIETNAQAITIKDGYWDAPSTWQDNRMPDTTTPTTINHEVRIRAGTLITVSQVTVYQTLIVDAGGYISFG